MTILSKDGYVVKKSEIKNVKIEEELMMAPKGTEDYGAKPRTFPIYTKDKDNYYLPKFYGIEKFGKPDKDLLHKGKSIDIKFKGDLRDYQKNISNLIQDNFKKIGGGIISLPCGRGKTIVSIEAIVRTGVKTLVVVHKEFLVKQWIRQIKKFTNANVGRIQRNTVETKGKDIVVAMLKSLSMIDYKKEIFEEFGLVVVDECHHIGAEVYSRALPKITSRYTLGLSATPTRNDGMSKIFYWHLGPIIYKEDLRKNNKVHAKIYKFSTDHPLFKNKLNWATKKPNKEGMINGLVAIPERTQLIINLINERRSRGDYCKILILSRRIGHLKEMKESVMKYIKRDKFVFNNLKKSVKYLERRLKTLTSINFTREKEIKQNKKSIKSIKKELESLNPEVEKYEKRGYQKTAYYKGGMKQEALTKAEECDIIFGTFDMAEEGLDIPNLNTIVLATPKPKVVQSVGRILRLEDYEIAPEVIDIADQLSLFTNFGIARKKYYIASHYHIHEYSTKLTYDTDNTYVIDKQGNKANTVTNISLTKTGYIDSSKIAISEKPKKKVSYSINDIINDDSSEG